MSLEAHIHHAVLGFGTHAQCYIVETKSYGGSIGVRSNYLRKCADPTHTQAMGEVDDDDG